MAKRVAAASFRRTTPSRRADLGVLGQDGGSHRRGAGILRGCRCRGRRIPRRCLCVHEFARSARETRLLPARRCEPPSWSRRRESALRLGVVLRKLAAATPLRHIWLPKRRPTLWYWHINTFDCRVCITKPPTTTAIPTPREAYTAYGQQISSRANPRQSTTVAG